MTAPDKFPVTFAITGIPETSGLRIKSLEPKGLYVSSMDPHAAKHHFELLAIPFVLRLNADEAPEDMAWTLESKVDWDKALIDGSGEVTVLSISMEEILREGLPKPMEPADKPDKLHIEWMLSPTKTPCCLAGDLSANNEIDNWLIAEAIADFQKPGN